MSADPVQHHNGHHHTAMIYGSDDEFVSAVVPFLEGAIDVGEPAFASFGARNTALLRDALGDSDRVTYLGRSANRARPAQALRVYRSLFEQLLEDGAPQFRSAGEVPHPGTGAPWDPWSRFEAAVNHLYAGLPGRSLCCYDARLTPDEVLVDVERTHPFLATAAGDHIASVRYEPADRFLATRSAPADPIEQQRPVVHLVDPTPAAARSAARGLGLSAGLPDDELDDLVIAVSEVVTNAICHGIPPVLVRAWAARDRVVVRVEDRGNGPADPFAGLIPTQDPRRRAGGLGLWLAEQLCAQVGYTRTDHGFAIRLIAGQPLPL